MRPFVRRSGHVARTSQTSINPSIRAAASRRILPVHTSSCISRTTRQYATIPPIGPQKPKKQSDDEKLASKKNNASASSNQNKTQKVEKDDGTVAAEASEEKLKPGHLPLTQQEENLLKELESHANSRLTEANAEDVRKVLAKVRESGIPPEAREVLQHWKAGKLDVMSSVKLIRHAVSILRTAADEAARDEANKRGPEQKSAHSPGPKEGKDGGMKNPFGGPNPFGQKPKGTGDSGGLSGGFKLDGTFLLTSALLTWITWSIVSPGESEKEITWQEFRTGFLERGLVEKLIILNHSRVKVFLHREAVASQNPQSPAVNNNFYYYFSIGSVEAFEKRLDDAQNEMQIPSSERIPVAYQEETPWRAALFTFGPTLLFIGAIVIFSRRAGGGGGQSGIFGMGKSRAKRFNHETDVRVKFSDVAGMDEAKNEIMEFVSFLKEPGIYQKLGAKIPRGAILSGPPGTGKTLIAKATAGESGVPFFSVSGSEFVEMFVGVGASRVRDLFATARKNTPCIIFIDEIDAIGRSRSSGKFNGGGNDEREATLNQILTEMDGFNTTEQVVVMAGTNRIDVLDKALLRPGRFDRHITIDKPTMDGRKQIFDVHIKKITTSEDIEHLKGRLAALTPGFSGADIANCVNEAALIAARSKAVSVSLAHFEQAIERVIGGLERKSLVLSPEEKRVVAYHEAGHAICGWFFKYADPLLKVSIIPRGSGALGYAQYLPSNGDTYLMNANQLMDRMAMTLGGRVSEELHFDTVTSGASDDFKKVTQMATAMVTRFGMSRKIGYLSFDDDGQQFHKPFSEETAKNIDSEVRRIVEDAYKQCKDKLTEKKHEVGLVAEELLSKEVLSRDDLVRLLGPRPFEDKGEFHKYFSGGEAGIPGPPGTGDNPNDGLPGGPTPAPVAFKKVE